MSGPEPAKKQEAETATSIVQEILHEQGLSIAAVEALRHILLSPDGATPSPVAENRGLVEDLRQVRANAIRIGTLASAIRDTL